MPQHSDADVSSDVENRRDVADVRAQSERVIAASLLLKGVN
jgi:hypothetical protein